MSIWMKQTARENVIRRIGKKYRNKCGKIFGFIVKCKDERDEREGQVLIRAWPFMSKNRKRREQNYVEYRVA